VKVRRLVPGEAALLKAIRLRALADSPDAFAQTHAEISAKPDAYWEQMTHGLTRPDGHAMLLAEDDGVVVGMAFGVVPNVRPQDRPGAPHLGGMWIEPAARGGGVGRALAEAVLDWARERGYGLIALWVTEGNAPAIALYERMGFVRTGRTDRLPSNPALETFEMERPL
jgi:GNAT superfamily N-acetyltransferase